MTIVSGLEMSVSNSGLGGLSSAFRLLEVAHTFFWTKDMLDNVQNGLHPNSMGTPGGSGNSSDVSQYGSRENLDQSYGPDSISSDHSPTPGHSPNTGNTGPGSMELTRHDQESSQLFRDLIMKKKQLLLGRLSSVDSECEETASVAASDTGSLTTNPAFVRGSRGFSSIRSAISDNEMSDSVGLSYVLKFFGRYINKLICRPCHPTPCKDLTSGQSSRH